MTATVHPDESSQRLTELNALGFQLFQEKLYPQALDVLQQIVDLTAKQRGQMDPDLGLALLNRGRVFRLLERNAECEADYQKALEILRLSPATHQAQIVWLLNNLRALYRNTGHHSSQAESVLRELLAMQRAALPSGDPQLAELLVDLGAVCYQQGNVQEAMGVFGEALAIREQALGADHPQTTRLRQVLAGLNTPSSPSAAPAAAGSTDPGQDQFNDCIRGFLRQDYPGTSQRALALIRAGTMTHGLLQVLLISLQRSGQAELLAQVAAQVPEIAESVPWERTLLDLTLGNADPNAALSHAQNDEQRGQVFYYAAERMITVGHGERATELLSRAVALLPKGFDRILAAARLSAQPGATTVGGTASPPTHPAHAASSPSEEAHRLYDRGAVHLTQGELDEAESCYRRALEIQEATPGADAAARTTRKELAGVLAAKGDLEAAVVLYRGVLADEKSLGAHHSPEWLEMALMLTRFYAAKHDDAALEGLLGDAVDVSRIVHGAHAPATLDVLDRLVALLIDRRRFADAHPFCVELLNGRRASAETPPSDLADALDSMAQIASGLGDAARAEALWQEALTVSSKTR